MTIFAIMKKILLFLVFCAAMGRLAANDCAFYAAGNQFIPINETDIRVQKEILTINRVGKHLEVTVYYEFFNPVGEKDLLVGFEAPAPYNGVYFKNFPEQPYMHDFKVVMNGKNLPYEIAHVYHLVAANGERFYFSDNQEQKNNGFITPDYFQHGKIKSLTPKQCKDTIENSEGMTCPFHYVYHFKAHFNKGLNIIQHTYKYELSMSVGDEYWFDYILTAANRWANHQIDDFTLNINMGDCESFTIEPTFFKDNDDWTITGTGKKNYTTLDGNDQPLSFFHIQNGGISFHQQNFHPEGELSIRKPMVIWWFWNQEIYSAEHTSSQWMNAFQWEYTELDTVAFNYLKVLDKDSVFSKKERKILKQFPLAYHGYVFTDKKLQKYFSKASWYIPNPAYKPDPATLTDKEKEWMKYWERGK